jgi:hypothetical protein
MQRKLSPGKIRRDRTFNRALVFNLPFTSRRDQSLFSIQPKLLGLTALSPPGTSPGDPGRRCGKSGPTQVGNGIQ